MAKAKKKKKAAPGVMKLENQRRELFCRYFAQNNQYFNNGTQAYAAAYGYELEQLSREAEYKVEIREEEDGDEHLRERTVSDSPYDKACHVCAVEAGRLLRIPEIQARIQVLRNEWMTDAAVDAELASVIQQNVELGPKMQGIKEVNKLRKRIDDRPIINNTIFVDPAIQAQIDKAVGSFLTHDNQGNISQ